MPDGGLDSRNLSEALRRRPVTPVEALELAVPCLVGCGPTGEVCDASVPPFVAMAEDRRSYCLVWMLRVEF